MCYNNILKKIFDDYVLFVICIIINRLCVLWIIEEIRVLKCERRRVEKKWRRFKFEIDFVEFKKKRNFIIVLMDKV